MACQPRLISNKTYKMGIKLSFLDLMKINTYILIKYSLNKKQASKDITSPEHFPRCCSYDKRKKGKLGRVR